MYTKYYNLKEKPFNITPSSRFLYLSESHEEALSLLTYGVVERKGLTVLTGDIGTGKTTMIKALLTNLNKNIHYIILNNPLLSSSEFIDYISCLIFKRKMGFKSKGDFLLETEKYLIECLHSNIIFIIIIDEAHKLSFELLEEIRLLNNMESDDEKLINFFLVGQPELNDKLLDDRCRSLIQRINSRYHLLPLNFEDTRDYIFNRLKIAGASNYHQFFSSDAIKTIYDYTDGYPRSINILADNCLLFAYSQEKKQIVSSIVTQCYQDMIIPFEMDQHLENDPEPSISREKKLVTQQKTLPYWKLATFSLLFIVIVVLLAFTQFNKDIQDKSKDFAELVINKEQMAIPENQNELAEISTGKTETYYEKSVSDHVPLSFPLKKAPVIAIKMEETFPDSIEEPERLTQKPKTGRIKSHSTITPITTPEMKNSLLDSENDFLTIKVKRGDITSKLIAKAYGRSSNDKLKLVLRYNPDIKDIHNLKVGQALIIPPRSFLNQDPFFSVHIGSFALKNAINLFRSLQKDGYQVYVVATSESLNHKKAFRVTLGNFQDSQKVKNYERQIISSKVSQYAKAIWVQLN